MSVCVLALASLPAFAADAAAGKTVYDSKCKTCHAADGTGNPGMAKALKVEFKPLGGADVQAMSDDDLKKAVSMGFGKMKPVTSVTGGDLDNVIAFVRTLKK
jgi:cytochrome c5